MTTKLFGIIITVILVTSFHFCTTTIADNSVDLMQLYHTADELYGQANYEDALTKYQEALQESKKEGVETSHIDKDFTTLANFKIAVTYSRLAEQTGNVNHYNTALQHIKKVAPTASVPQHQQAITYLWGHILYRTGQYEHAEEKFLQLIDNFPNSIQVENALYAIGQLNYKQLNHEPARIAFRKLLTNYPASDFKDDAQLLIAQTYLDEQNYEKAYPEFDKFATKEFRNYPELHAESMYKAAYCLKQLEKYDEAIKRYSNFVIRFPDNNLITAVYFDQGAIHAKQSDYDRARANYKLALQKTMNQGLQSEIQVAIGQTYFDQADYENAIDAYTALIKVYPDSTFIAEAKLGLADSHFRLKSWNKAIAAYKDVIEYEKSGIQRFESVDLNFTPYCSFQVGDAYYKLAKQQMQAGETEQGMLTLELALQWQQQTYEEFPENPVAQHAVYGAIWTLNDLERKEDMMKLAREFIETNRNDNEFDILAAEAQLHLADTQRINFMQYVESAEEYAKIWDYRTLSKFHLVKLMAKHFEGRSYFEAAKLEDNKTGEQNAPYSAEYLNKSLAAYQEVLNHYSDNAFLPGVSKGLYKDFPKRISYVHASTMNAALSHQLLGNSDKTLELYKSIPESSEYYGKAQLLLQNLDNQESLFIPDDSVIKPESGKE